MVVLLMSPSHHCYLLLSTQTVHFHRKQLFYFPCPFNDFLNVLDDKRKKRLHLQENLDKARDRIKKSVQKMTQVAQGNKLDQKRFSAIFFVQSSFH